MDAVGWLLHTVAGTSPEDSPSVVSVVLLALVAGFFWCRSKL